MAYIEEIFRILCYILYVHIFGSRLAEIIAMPATCVQRFAYSFSDSAHGGILTIQLCVVPLSARTRPFHLLNFAHEGQTKRGSPGQVSRLPLFLQARINDIR